MATVLVDTKLPVPFDANELRGRRQNLRVTVASPNRIREQLVDSDVFITSNGSWNDAYLDSLEEGDWVQTIGAGYDRFPLRRFEEADIVFSNATGIHGTSASEHVLALLLSFVRRLHEFRDAQRNNEWTRRYGKELAECQLTVLGVGNIGEEIATRATALGMDVCGLKRDVDTYDGCLGPDDIYPSDQLVEPLPETDFLVVTVPLSEETRQIIDRSILETLPRSAVVVNIARGGVLDQDALITALENGSIAGAGLDVFATEPLPESSPLWEFDNVIITPHLAGVSDRYAERFTELFLSMYDCWRTGAALECRVV